MTNRETVDSTNNEGDFELSKPSIVPTFQQPSKMQNIPNEDKAASHTSGDIYKGSDKFFFPNGDVYEGDFCAHVKGVIWREGYGTYTSKDGHSYHGLWADDKLVENINLEIKYPSGAEYRGPIVGNKYNGPGQYIFENKLILSCEFENNEPKSPFIILDKNGKYWHGSSNPDGTALVLPEHIYYTKLEPERGIGKPREKPKTESVGKVDTEEDIQKDVTEEVIEKELEKKVFAKSFKVDMDVDFESSPWYDDYIEFRTTHRRIMSKVQKGDFLKLDANERMWYTEYKSFKERYKKLLAHYKDKTLIQPTDNLWRTYSGNIDECPPISVIYPSPITYTIESSESEMQEEEEDQSLVGVQLFMNPSVDHSSWASWRRISY